MSHAVKFMTPVLGVHNVYGLVQPTFWRWSRGTDVKQVKSLRHRVPKIAWDVNDANRHARLTF
jgi:hypothetical protein